MLLPLLLHYFLKDGHSHSKFYTDGKLTKTTRTYSIREKKQTILITQQRNALPHRILTAQNVGSFFGMHKSSILRFLKEKMFLTDDIHCDLINRS